jgi:hypothetical protein
MELADSIRIHGVLQALTVIDQDAGVVVLVDGERRWRASQIAGLTEVPCDVWPSTTRPADAVAAGVVLNEHREAHSCLHVAKRLRQLKNEYALDAASLAQRTGVAIDRVKSYGSLWAGSDQLLEYIDRRGVTLTVSMHLVRFEKECGEGTVRRFLGQMGDQPLTAPQVMAARQKHGKAGPAGKPGPKVVRRAGLMERITAALARDREAALEELTAVL